MKKIYWGDYTTYELEQLIKNDPVILLPVGAYEQHGAHLAVNTDKIITERICEEIVRSSASPCTMLPSVWCGISEHHMKFTGSLTLKHETLSAFVFDVLDSLVRNGIRKILAINSHGGNIAAISEPLTKASYKYDGTFAVLTYWNLISDEISKYRKSEFGGISHACEMETSLQLFLQPENVRLDCIPPANNVRGGKFWSPEMFASNKISMYMPYDQLSKHGHIGDPRKATKEFGEIIFNTIIEKSLKLVKAIQKGELLNEDF